MIHVGDITREKRLDHPKDVLEAGAGGQGAGARDRPRAPAHPPRNEAVGADQHGPLHRRACRRAIRSPAALSRSRTTVSRSTWVRVYSPPAGCRSRLPKSRRPPSPRAGAEIVGEHRRSDGAKLAARWKQGGSGSETPSAASKGNQMRPGQVRTFKIVALEAEHKRDSVGNGSVALFAAEPPKGELARIRRTGPPRRGVAQRLLAGRRVARLQGLPNSRRWSYVNAFPRDNSERAV